MAKFKQQEMLSVIIDTNVIVSGLISDGIPRLILRCAIREKFLLALSNDVWAEYEDVLQREKFRKYPNFMDDFDLIRNEFKSCGKWFYPTEKIDLLTDVNDNLFLELALVSNADFLITGNKKHFPMDLFEGTRIVSPSTFWKSYENQ